MNRRIETIVPDLVERLALDGDASTGAMDAIYEAQAAADEAAVRREILAAS